MDMASNRIQRWAGDYVLWVEAFALGNLAFLALDIYIAHSENGFLRRAEYVPLYFSLAAPVLLAIALLSREFWGKPRLWSGIGYAVGLVSIGLGLSGVLYHLDSQFFYERTLRSLTYAAPFAAPLAYTGVGMLLLLNRMEPTPSEQWARWVLFLSLGGFFGNLVLSLTDHAENGFFHWTEWIPVASSSFVVAFLAVFFFVPLTDRYLKACGIALLVQALVGLTGFVLHAEADLHGVSRSFFQNVINGAPPFAPLLFPNLMILGLIGLWVIRRHC
jgi:hypothetical protein